MQEQYKIEDTTEQGYDTIIDRAFDETSWNGIVRRGREGRGVTVLASHWSAGSQAELLIG